MAVSYYGAPGTQQTQLINASNPGWEALTGRLDVPFRRLGGLMVALDADEEQRLQETLEEVHACGVRAELLTARQVRDTEPLVSQHAVAGLLLPDELGGWRDLGRVAATPGHPATLSAPVQVRGAVAGSAYGVQAVVRAVTGDVETAALLPGTIRVLSATPLDWKQVVQRVAIGLAVLFVVTEVVLGVRALRRRHAA